MQPGIQTRSPAAGRSRKSRGCSRVLFFFYTQTLPGNLAPSREITCKASLGKLFCVANSPSLPSNSVQEISHRHSFRTFFKKKNHLPKEHASKVSKSLRHSSDIPCLKLHHWNYENSSSFPRIIRFKIKRSCHLHGAHGKNQ